jgi:hypothetical protein
MMSFAATRKTWIHIDRAMVEAEELKAVFGKSLALAAGTFSEYVRDNYLSGQALNVGEGGRKLKSGEYRPGGITRESTRFYRMKDKRVSDLPRYMVRPGVGIPGSLNYLYGIARGQAVSESGKRFYYAKPIGFFIEDAWKAWGGGKEVRKLGEAVQSSWLRQLASRSPDVEAIGEKA